MKQLKKWRTVFGFTCFITAIFAYLFFQFFFIFTQPLVGWSLFLSGYILNLFAFLIQQRQKRVNPSSRNSWAILFIIVPLIPAILYFMGSYVPKIHTKHIKEALAFEETLFLDSNQRLNLENINPIFNKNSEIEKKPFCLNTTLIPFTSQEEKFEALLKDIEEAKEYIYVQYFILNGGIFFEKLINLLIKKKKEGVVVRILSDYVGNVGTPNNTYKEIKQNNIPFFMYNTVILPFTTGFSNFRNHNKIIVIDNKKAYFGGMNIGDDYSSLYSHLGYWSDLHFKVTGEFVEQLNKLFISDWFKVTGEKINNEFSNLKPELNEQNFPIQLLTDGPLQKQTIFLDNLIELINNAKHTIKLSSPYILLPKKLTQALLKAKERGVKIKILTAGRPDKKIAFFFGKFYVEELRGLGIEVYRLENSFNHSKVYLFDDEMVLTGTSNMDFRSFYYHWESNALIQSKNVSKQLTETFDKNLEISYLEEKTIADWGFTKKIIFHIVRFLSPMF